MVRSTEGSPSKDNAHATTECSSVGMTGMTDTVEIVGVVDHELDRRRTLRAYSRGEITREAICDASREVRSSAEVLGVSAGRQCPLCDRELRDTWWIHSAAIGEKSGTARSLAEIRQLLSALPVGSDLMVHTVEVCLYCGWNYLLREEEYRGAAAAAQ